MVVEEERERFAEGWKRTLISRLVLDEGHRGHVDRRLPFENHLGAWVLSNLAGELADDFMHLRQARVRRVRNTDALLNPRAKANLFGILAAEVHRARKNLDDRPFGGRCGAGEGFGGHFERIGGGGGEFVRPPPSHGAVAERGAAERGRRCLVLYQNQSSPSQQ